VVGSVKLAALLVYLGRHRPVHRLAIEMIPRSESWPHDHSGSAGVSATLMIFGVADATQESVPLPGM
jgi:hypothetical protein